MKRRKKIAGISNIQLLIIAGIGALAYMMLKGQKKQEIPSPTSYSGADYYKKLFQEKNTNYILDANLYKPLEGEQYKNFYETYILQDILNKSKKTPSTPDIDLDGLFNDQTETALINIIKDKFPNVKEIKLREAFLILGNPFKDYQKIV